MTDINRIVQKECTQHKPEKHTEPIKLTNKAVNPFDTWTDFYAEDGEAVITFITMKEHMFEEWQNQVVHIGYNNNNLGRLATINGQPIDEDDSTVIYTHLNFENNFEGPGIYQDGVHYRDDDKVDESYTVIVPEEFMTREICGKYLEKLNNEYNRDFYFEDVDYENRRAEFIKADIENDDELDIEGMTTEDVKKIMEHIIY